MKSPWAAIGVTMLVLIGLGLINSTTRKIAIFIAVALAMVMALKKLHY